MEFKGFYFSCLQQEAHFRAANGISVGLPKHREIKHESFVFICLSINNATNFKKIIMGFYRQILPSFAYLFKLLFYCLSTLMSLIILHPLRSNSIMSHRKLSWQFFVLHHIQSFFSVGIPKSFNYITLIIIW